MTDSSDFNKPREPRFATTQWTRVVAARGDSDEARAALGELCTAYYRPVESFIERTCRSRQDARDLTHDFFAQVLDGHGFDRAMPNRGRFRSYLLGCVKHFLADANDRRMAAKRGSGKSPMSIDQPSQSNGKQGTATDDRVPCIDPEGFPPDAWFDREWAVALLDRVLTSMAQQHEAANRATEFEQLKPYLTGDAALPTSVQLGEQLGVSAEAAAMTIHRLRKKFRTAVKAEIANTVVKPDDIRLELDYLVQALSLVSK